MTVKVFVLGWKEWCALPGLGIPALKVKVDTGARTSSIHALDIETIGAGEDRKVRFKVHPVPGRPDIEIACVADLVDIRDVTSSNGEAETRHVIETPIMIGDKEWRIQLTLTDRGGMQFHMLLGRQAFDAFTGEKKLRVQPTSGYLQKRHNYSEYDENWGTGHALLREEFIYRLMPPAIWTQAQAEGHLPYAEIDNKDGYFHLSTAAQLMETARLHYSDHPKLIAVGAHPDILAADLKWEESRGGQLFPHFYGKVPTSQAAYLLDLQQSDVEDFEILSSQELT